MAGETHAFSSTNKTSTHSSRCPLTVAIHIISFIVRLIIFMPILVVMNNNPVLLDGAHRMERRLTCMPKNMGILMCRRRCRPIFHVPTCVQMVHNAWARGIQLFTEVATIRSFVPDARLCGVLSAIRRVTI